MASVRHSAEADMVESLDETVAPRNAGPGRNRATAPEAIAPSGRSESRRAAAVPLLAAYLLLATLPLLIALTFRTRADDPPLYEVGRAAALLAFSLLALEVVLAGRFKFADRAFGLDAVMRFHRSMGILACFLSLAHPVLLLLSTHGHIPWEWRVALGAAALLILVIGVLATLAFRILRIDYSRWRFLHKAMILVLILGYAHSRSIGEDLLSSRALRASWTALLAMGVGVFLWRNVFVPRWGRRSFRVESVSAEARDVWTIKMVPADGSTLSYWPGQFIFLTLLRPGLRVEEHPFTISSSPGQGDFVTVTVKQSGDYTRSIGQTRPGDRALVEGPFGMFSLVHHDAESYLFVGAGVGSTPLVSMIRFLRDTADPRPVLFLCANRTSADILFRHELDQLPPHMKVVHVLSRPDADWVGPKGRLDDKAIQRLAGVFLRRADVFLCGPPALMEDLRGSLRRLGVRNSRIHCERFTVP
jgi:predicted ferric reductase